MGKFTSSNSKVVIAVVHADEINVHFRFKAGPLVAWRDRTLPERKLFINSKFRWDITIKLNGDDDHCGEHEFAVNTNCDYLEMAEVVKELLDQVTQGWEVLENIEIHSVPRTRK